MSKIDDLLKASKEVLQDCFIENGAIVGINTDKEYVPTGVNNYRFVWVRDAAFMLHAAEILGIEGQKDLFLEWLLSRAEGFSKTGKIAQRYGTHGIVGPYYGGNYQPDQAGCLIWLLIQEGEISDENKNIIKLLADGLVKDWDLDHFKVRTFDVWEQKHTVPELGDNLPFTLAACSFGLQKASEMLEEQKYSEIANQMKAVLDNDEHDFYPKRLGQIPDERIDASVLGIVWPFNVVADQEKLKRSVKEIETKLINDQGVKRHDFDEYDGNVEGLRNWIVKAGAWPHITFWYFIALSKLGREKEAKELFEKYIEQFEDYIPEQVFDNDIQKSFPLGWSHAMFVIAAKELGYI